MSSRNEVTYTKDWDHWGDCDSSVNPIKIMNFAEICGFGDRFKMEADPSKVWPKESQPEKPKPIRKPKGKKNAR